ncbi:MAG: protease modulator HflC [Defluviitaleaceae bacterium]|nr:protease modulator HflC [Defluviitaleaceae bacterium]
MKIIDTLGKFCKIFIVLLVITWFAFQLISVTVPAGQAAYVMRFGEVIDVHTKPGLYFKWPIYSISFVPINKQLYNLNPSDVITLDKKTMNVSSFVVWQINDPLSVMQNLGPVSEVTRRIENIVYNAIKNTLSNIEQETIITLRGGGLSDSLMDLSKDRMQIDFGVNINTIKINQFDLPPDNKEAVYRRMISERESIAAMYIAEGAEEAKMIRNAINPERDILLSKASADADKLRAEGEAEYMRILAEAYSGEERAEFYTFIRSLDALKISMKGDKTLMLPLDTPLMKWLGGY